jgi:fructoselysine 6-kinase
MGAGDAFITAFLCHYLGQTNTPDEEAIPASLKQAALFSAKICLKGAFGYGVRY